MNFDKHKICVCKTCGNLLHNLKYNHLNRGKEAKLEAKKRTIFIITENSSIIAK